MSFRIHVEPTPEGRIAASAHACFKEKTRCGNCKSPLLFTDIADLKEYIFPIVLKELLTARLDDAKRALGATKTAQERRIDELTKALAMIVERGEQGRVNE